ncbi:MAG TPA: class I SAM-dependent DNA methyltransferase, partial [Chitinophagaceae bacterium]|nr:class I SAM-dependent DNA methyltransferase [Chitinophagaceae bacterium]
ADQLRANSKLTASEYTMPILGLIFLRHASNRFDQVKAEIEPLLPVHPTRGKKSLTVDMFWSKGVIYIPTISHFNYLVDLKESEDIGKALDDAMREIEKEHEFLKGVLPKTYTTFEKSLLLELLRIFNKEALRNAKGDVFGKIYEYFLNEFAMKGAQEGGEFFTPLSLVSVIVNFIEPLHGIVFDPACGSFGMAVQSGHFIENKKLDPNNVVTFYGQEKTTTNTQIAKMNMAVHGYDANKIVEGNTFYEDKHELIGKCSYVMANPPFNVDKVDKEREAVKKDPRLPFGLPKNDNANYLWIQYFYAYLNPTGRAGFVMASSASDAGHSEKLIRQQLVETGAVDIMVSVGNNFFYTRSLPCTLWFYDKAKAQDKKRCNHILMLDARKIFRKVSTTVNDFSPEQLENLTCIVKLYRGENDYMQELVRSRNQQIDILLQYLEIDSAEAMLFQLQTSINIAETANAKIVEHLMKEILDIAQQIKTLGIKSNQMLKSWKAVGKDYKKDAKATEDVIQLLSEYKQGFAPLQKQSDALPNTWRNMLKLFRESKLKFDNADKAKEGIDQFLNKLKEIHERLIETEYQCEQHLWLLSRFPKGVYNDVQGLSKLTSNKEVSEKEYSLSPGRYVGVEEDTNQDENWEASLQYHHAELEKLNKEANALSKAIFENYKSIGG